MSSTRHRPAALGLSARKIALFPLSDEAMLEVEISAGCEQFIGRFARLDCFRFRGGIIRFCAGEG
ncbi:MAG: hypothetical protein ABR601_09540 [Parasphingopyxis sp.]